MPLADPPKALTMRIRPGRVTKVAIAAALLWLCGGFILMRRRDGITVHLCQCVVPALYHRESGRGWGVTRAGWGTHAGQSHDTFPCTIDRRAHVSRGTAHLCVTGMLRTLTARNAEEFESVYQYKRPLLLTAPNAVDLDAWQASTQRLLAQPQPV